MILINIYNLAFVGWYDIPMILNKYTKKIHFFSEIKAFLFHTESYILNMKKYLYSWQYHCWKYILTKLYLVKSKRFISYRKLYFTHEKTFILYINNEILLIINIEQLCRYCTKYYPLFFKQKLVIQGRPV